MTPPLPLQQWERREVAVAIAAAMYPEVRDVIARGIARQAVLMLEQQDEALVRQWRQMAGPVA